MWYDLEVIDGVSNVEVKHIWFLDIGSGAYTTFETDGEEMIEYTFEKHPEILNNEWKMGLIHSHHSMNAYFSGTDWDELMEKANWGVYCSLIVSDNLKWCAKIAEKAVIKEEVRSFSTEVFGFKFNEKTESIEKEVVVVQDLEISCNALGYRDEVAKMEKERRGSAYKRVSNYSSSKSLASSHNSMLNRAFNYGQEDARQTSLFTTDSEEFESSSMLATEGAMMSNVNYAIGNKGKMLHSMEEVLVAISDKLPPGMTEKNLELKMWNFVSKIETNMVSAGIEDDVIQNTTNYMYNWFSNQKGPLAYAISSALDDYYGVVPEIEENEKIIEVDLDDDTKW